MKGYDKNKKRVAGDDSDDDDDDHEVVGGLVPATPGSPSPSLDRSSRDDESDVDGSPPPHHQQVAVTTPLLHQHHRHSTNGHHHHHHQQHNQHQQHHPIQQFRQSARASWTPSQQQPQQLVAATAGSSTTADDDNNNDNNNDTLLELLIPQRRQRLEVIFWCGATLYSAIVFLYVVLPWTAFMWLTMSLVSASALLYTTAINAAAVSPTQIIDYMLRHQWFPAGLQHLLFENTLHDWLAPNPDIDWNRILNENRHLLLYFLPLEPHRLMQLIDQLPPRHARQLHQPGFLARTLLGNDYHYNNHNGAGATARRRRLQHQQQADVSASAALVSQQQQEPTAAAWAAASSSSSRPHQRTRRRLDLDSDDNDDSSSDLGLDDLTANDMVAGGLSDRQATRLASSLGLFKNRKATAVPDDEDEDAAKKPVSSSSRKQQSSSSSPATDSSSSSSSSSCSTTSSETIVMDEQEEYALEERLLTEAITTIVCSFCVPFVQTMATYVSRNWLRPASRMLWRAGASLSVTAIGLSGLGYYNRNYYALPAYRGGVSGGTSTSQSNRLGILITANANWSLIISRITSPRAIWTTAVVGAGTLGIAWIAHSVAGMMMTTPSQQEQDEGEIIVDGEQQQHQRRRRRRSSSASQKKKYHQSGKKEE